MMETFSTSEWRVARGETTLISESICEGVEEDEVEREVRF